MSIFGIGMKTVKPGRLIRDVPVLQFTEKFCWETERGDSHMCVNIQRLRIRHMGRVICTLERPLQNGFQTFKISVKSLGF